MCEADGVEDKGERTIYGAFKETITLATFYPQTDLQWLVVVVEGAAHDLWRHS